MGFFDKIVSGAKERVERDSSERERNESYDHGQRGYVKGAVTGLRGGNAPSNEEVDDILNRAKKR